MKQIKIADQTLVQNQASLTFKEKIEIARYLDNLYTDVIELPQLQNIRTDTLLVQTVSAFVKNSTLSVETGMTEAGIEQAAAALSNAKKGRLRISLPVSSVQMEYNCHLKAPKMQALAEKLFAAAAKTGIETEFCAVDSTRAEEPFLIQMITLALQNGIQKITLCDHEAALLPDEFANFITGTVAKIQNAENLQLGVFCANNSNMVNASAILAVKAGAQEVKCAVDGPLPDLDSFCSLLHSCAERCQISTGIKHTELHRITRQIGWVLNGCSQPAGQQPLGEEVPLDATDDINAVRTAVLKLGYELSAEDEQRVFEEFKRMAGKKKIGAKELDAIVASVAMQVPPTYQLVSYVVNNGNIISSSAQVKLQKRETEREGICIGDGPVDAAFRAIEQIIGTHYELDDFQIHSVTEGRDSVGTAVVKLRANGKVYAGTGISTDIIGAAIRAYINVVNKIVYEEATVS